MNNTISNLTSLQIPLSKCGSFLRKLSNHLYSSSTLCSILPLENKSYRLLLLNPSIPIDLSTLPEDLQIWIKGQSDVSIISYDIEIEGTKLKKSKSMLIEPDPLAEVLPKEIDSNIIKETLKQIMIVNLQREQMPFKLEIAKFLLERSEGEVKTVLCRIDLKEDYFLTPHYDFIAGDRDTSLLIEEDQCHFSLDLLSYFYDSSLQAERDRVFSYFDQKDIVLDIGSNLILALRMAKLGLRVIMNIKGKEELKGVLEDNMKRNSIEEGSLIVLNKDLPTFLKKTLGESPFGNIKETVRHIYISRFIWDLSFISNIPFYELLNFLILGLFIGLGVFLPLADGYKEEKQLPFLYFYYVLDLKATKSKIKEHIIEVLNQDIEVFQKEDLEEIVMLNQFGNEFTQKVFMVRIKLTNRVLMSPRPLINEVLKGKGQVKGKRSAGKGLKEESEKEIENDIIERRSPRKKGTPNKVLHIEKK